MSNTKMWVSAVVLTLLLGAHHAVATEGETESDSTEEAVEARHSSQCKPSILHATCDNKMTLYLDGVRQGDPNWQEWTKKSSFRMTTCTKVVAIKCVDLHVVGGILASNDNGMITDEAWRCTETYQPGWERPNFVENVAVWKKATAHGYNNAAPWNGITGISQKAKWIWTANNKTPKTVYCRKTMFPPHCLPLTLYATCDNQMTLYLDGVHQADPNRHDWTKKSSFAMTTCTKVIGIKCFDYGVVGGVLASTSNGMTTDESWHCTETYQPGWEQPTFVENVSVWKRATAHGYNNAAPWNGVTGISKGAKWIWTADNKTPKTVYCRIMMHRCAC